MNSPYERSLGPLINTLNVLVQRAGRPILYYHGHLVEVKW